MKYGETFQAQSVPQWAPYNVDYNELKNLIKVHTTKDQGQAIAIPGHADLALAKFEYSFFNELSNQHDRVDLFVSSKAAEVGRRLESYQRDFLRLRARCEYSTGKPMSRKRREKFARYDNQITNDLISNVRAHTPDVSEASTPRTRSRRTSVQPVEPPPQQGYWNEYDDGSEAEHEVYTIYVDPDSDESYPGSKAVSFLVSKAKLRMEKVKGWLSPASRPYEREPLMGNGNGNGNSNGNRGYPPDTPDTDIDDDAYASSSDFPTGYATHFAALPSIHDQRFSQERRKFLIQGIIGAFVASLLLMAIAGILVATGRHKLRIEVDAGVFTGVAASLFFATMAFAGMLYEHEKIGAFYRWGVILTFAIICVLNSFIMAMVMSDTRL
ncbi:hypothetical protein D0Z07_7749 [Hyphodiscus hymeniophilus]|uniref:SPX domain-containing protein n=1 Tax=Hyphodiscus hymeniophilus TaxID=353542 RepID=A0A9P6SNN2_9HELO|nr:hypothetical protein D0Z07_7749 [Hyphodiscus hymeniophilus]